MNLVPVELDRPLPHVARVFLNRPEVRNAFNEAAIAGLAAVFTRLGLPPSTISPYVVRALGAQAPKRHFVTAERFSAAQAHALGFVHEVGTAESLDAKAWRGAERLTA